MIVKNEDIIDKSDFAILVIDKYNVRYFIAIQEGSGDNLLQSDYDDGCIDYSDYTCYKDDADGTLNTEDGGCIMHTEYCKDISVEDIISCVLDDLSIEQNNVTVIALPNDMNTTFFEDIEGQNIDDLDEDLANIYTKMWSYIKAANNT